MEGPGGLYLRWNFLDNVGPSLFDDVFENGKFVIFLCCYSQVVQAITSGFKLTGDLVKMKFW